MNMVTAQKQNTSNGSNHNSIVLSAQSVLSHSGTTWVFRAPKGKNSSGPCLRSHTVGLHRMRVGFPLPTLPTENLQWAERNQ